MAKIRNSGTIINTDYSFAKLIDGSLTNAIIPSSVNKINAYAFYNRTNLEKIDFADKSVVIIEDYSFQNCTALKSVKLPIGLTNLGTKAFDGCTALQKLIIPSTAITLLDFGDISAMKYMFFQGNNPITNQGWKIFSFSNLRLFDMRYTQSAKDIAGITANNVYLYINVPDSLYSQFTALPNWSALNLKRWVHSCDKATFEEIENPIDGDYYSLKGDTNYLNPLGEKQIIIKQFANGEWLEVDIDA
jgi:hypothetical protein